MGRRDIVFVIACTLAVLVIIQQWWRPPGLVASRTHALAHQTAANSTSHNSHSHNSHSHNSTVPRVAHPATNRTSPSTTPNVQTPPPELVSILARVDAEFQDEWQRNSITTANVAPFNTILRRLSLGLAGTIPSLEELRTLDTIPTDLQLDWWLTHLLADRRTSDYLAERLARVFVGTDDGPFLVYRRRRFVSWLSDQLHRGPVHYDAIARQLIAQDGLWTDAPAVNFVTVTSDPNRDNRPDPMRLANRVTRAFLGMRIDCLQCHDDRLEKVALGVTESPRWGRQEDFHHLAAFFSDVGPSITGIRDDRQAKPYEYQFLGETAERTVAPMVPYSPEIAPRDGALRKRLATWVTHPQNKPFARVTVNRFWAFMTGRPLVEPIDDIPLHGPFPPGLEPLADDFIEHGYDTRRLIRVIAFLHPYQLDSRLSPDSPITSTTTQEKSWALFPITRLRPEQVAGALSQASTLKTIDANAHIIRQLMKRNETEDFVRRYGDLGEDEFTDRGGTIPQRLLMMNGELVKERTKDNIVLNAATRVAALASSDEKAIEIAYLSILSRTPSREEQCGLVELIQNQRGSARNEALEDIWWILLNSTEFSWNH
ncbi:MAG: DUF1553 domain-containing protein [Planctomycetota bacterium]